MTVSLTSVAGIPSTTDPTAVVILSDQLRAQALEPAAAVAAVADRMAMRQGWRLHDVGLRLGDWLPAGSNAVEGVDELAPSDLGRLYELLLAPRRRRAGGVHLTPVDVAVGLIDMLDPAWVEGGLVVDPSVGGGAFLLNAVDRLVEHGVSPTAAWERMNGVDVDPAAVAIAESALALQLAHHDASPAPHPGLVAGDGLLDPLPLARVVLGNPPFLNQLRNQSSNAGERRARLRDRFGPLVGPYTDEAWLFLAASLEALAPDGQLALVQPVSILAARDAQAVRERIDHTAAFRGLWLSNGKVFDAAVEVCGVHVANRRDPKPRPLRRFAGRGFAPLDSLIEPPAPDRWGVAGSAIAGVPEVALPFGTSDASLATLAHATAGFRDQFYGFAPHVREGDAPTAEATPRLVTVGMIEPAELGWGAGTYRFAGSRWCRPVLDLDDLRVADPDLVRWVDARSVPKVLVATQTRVIEAWVDPTGSAVPATPVISVEPFHERDVWRVGALLLAPHLTALLAGLRFGSALSLRALKFSASDLLQLPLPTAAGPWDAAAKALKEASAAGESPGRGGLIEVARHMSEAYGAPDDNVLDWWIGRLRPASAVSDS